MKLSKAICGYKISKLADGYSENTIRGYQIHFQQLIEFTGDPEITKITAEQLKNFMYFLRFEYKPQKGKGGETTRYKTATLRNAWCAIRSLFGWYHDEIGLERPDLDLPKPEVTYPEILPFEEDEIRRLVKQCTIPIQSIRDGKAYTRKSRSADRDKALILLLLDTGIRATECAQIRIKDINLEDGTLFIRPVNSSRKNKSRVIRVGQACTKAIIRYLKLREKPYDSDPLFMTIGNRPMDRKSIRLTVQRIGRSAGIQDVYPHRFRHTFAIQFLRNGGDVFSLQYFLGHNDPTMTRHYLHLADIDITNAHRLASPADRWNL